MRASAAIVCLMLCGCNEPAGRPGSDTASPSASEAGLARERGAATEHGATGDVKPLPPHEAGGAPDGGSSVWRPFNSTSPWNTPIPANPSLEPERR